jgi:hypothetical protein
LGNEQYGADQDDEYDVAASGGIERDTRYRRSTGSKAMG